MSSLAAARADNFYYPPNFDPVKHKTLAKVGGTPSIARRGCMPKGQRNVAPHATVPRATW